MKVSEHNSLGNLIEIPAAAVLAELFAQYVDFLDFGTHDLITYSMAADRGNEHVTYLYTPYNPSILRLVKHVIDTAHKEGQWAGMCGEAAGELNLVPLLLGMGLDEYSMSDTSVLKVRSLMKRLSTEDMAQMADVALNENIYNDENADLVKKKSGT